MLTQMSTTRGHVINTACMIMFRENTMMTLYIFVGETLYYTYWVIRFEKNNIKYAAYINGNTY